jgi:hypothetical protein
MRARQFKHLFLYVFCLSCTQELAWCGDGTIQENAGEVCDGGTLEYWCSSDCWFKLAKDRAAEDLDGSVAAEMDGGL